MPASTEAGTSATFLLKDNTQLRAAFVGCEPVFESHTRVVTGFLNNQKPARLRPKALWLCTHPYNARRDIRLGKSASKFPRIRDADLALPFADLATKLFSYLEPVNNLYKVRTGDWILHILIGRELLCEWDERLQSFCRDAPKTYARPTICVRPASHVSRMASGVKRLPLAI